METLTMPGERPGSLDAGVHETSPLLSHQAPAHVSGITLAAKNKDLLAEFYQDKIGLDRMDDTPDFTVLGAGGDGFLTLIARPDAKPEPLNSAGLFHVAFLLPSRPTLGAWLLRSQERGVSLEAASDHGVSEAFYLSDPEGNGIEIYADKPKSLWPVRETGYSLHTQKMDIGAVAEEGRRLLQPEALPPETRIGHVHLKTGDLGEADTFYQGTLGMTLKDSRPGGAFYAFGDYHHHVAVNTWTSRGAGRRDPGLTGLEEVRFSAKIAAAFWKSAAPQANDATDMIDIVDPSGIKLRFALMS